MNSYQLKQTTRSKDLNLILKHPKIKLKIGEKVVQTDHGVF